MTEVAAQLVRSARSQCPEADAVEVQVSDLVGASLREDRHV